MTSEQELELVRINPVMIIGYMMLGVLLFMMGAVFGLELSGCANAIEIPI